MGDDDDDNNVDVQQGLQRVADIVALAQPSRSCHSHAVTRLPRYAMAAKEIFLQASAKQLLEKAQGAAALCWYSNDTTPMTAHKTFRNLVGGTTFVNRARQSGEYIIQRMFIQDASGNIACMLAEPQRATDKTAPTHFETYRNLFVYPRAIMGSGILVSAHVWDGALFSSCDRLHGQFMAAYHHQLHEDLDQGDAELNELTHWSMSSKCVLHLVHGSLKRSVIDYAEDKALMNKCWVTLEALRSFYGQLLKNAAAWVDARLYFEDWGMSYQADLWRALEV